MQRRAAIPTLCLMGLLGSVFPVSVASAAPAESTVDYCTIADSRIAETSGMVAVQDKLYVANDSGDSARVFELNQECAVTRVISGQGLTPRDVEDLAMDSAGALWLADIGDNSLTRQSILLDVLPADGRGSQSFRLQYPDGPHDAETLLLDSKDQPLLVTKQEFGNSGLYVPTKPLTAQQTAPLRKACDLKFGFTGNPGGPVGIISQLLATGGAVSDDGTQVAIRTYTDLYVWAAPDKNIEHALCQSKPIRTALPAEKQGEAVTFLPGSKDVLTASEGAKAPVHRVSVAAAPAVGSTPTASPHQQDAVKPPTDESDHHNNAVRFVFIGAVVVAGIGVIALFRARRSAR